MSGRVVPPLMRQGQARSGSADVELYHSATAILEQLSKVNTSPRNLDNLRPNTKHCAYEAYIQALEHKRMEI